MMIKRRHLPTYCGWTNCCTASNYGKPWFAGICNGIVSFQGLPGGAKWVSSVVLQWEHVSLAFNLKTGSRVQRSVGIPSLPSRAKDAEACNQCSEPKHQLPPGLRHGKVGRLVFDGVIFNFNCRNIHVSSLEVLDQIRTGSP